MKMFSFLMVIFCSEEKIHLVWIKVELILVAINHSEKAKLLLIFTQCYYLIVKTAFSFFNVFLMTSCFPNACQLWYVFILYPFVDGGKDVISPSRFLILSLIITDGFDTFMPPFSKRCFYFK